MLEHFRRWNIWRKHSLNSRWYKLLVLIFPRISPTYALTMTARDYEKYCHDWDVLFGTTPEEDTRHE